MRKKGNQRGATLTEYAVAVFLLIGAVALIAVPVHVEELDNNGATHEVTYPSQLARIVTGRLRISLGSISGNNGMAPCAISPENTGAEGSLSIQNGECY